METKITVLPGYRIKENWLKIEPHVTPKNNIMIKTKTGWKSFDWKPKIDDVIINDDVLSKVKTSTQFKGTTKVKKGGYHGVVLTLDNRVVMSSDKPFSTREKAKEDIEKMLNNDYYVNILKNTVFC